MGTIIDSLRMLIFMTTLTGLFYPLLVTSFAQLFYQKKAAGSYQNKHDVLVGSEMIGQKFESDRYFWSRPSATDYNSLPSGGSNLGAINLDLKKTVDGRVENLKLKHKSDLTPPQDLIFASASGLDPHISLQGAVYQAQRVAEARGMEATAMRQLIEQVAEGRQFGILGEPRVNVLKLNLSLDQWSEAQER